MKLPWGLNAGENAEFATLVKFVWVWRGLNLLPEATAHLKPWRPRPCSSDSTVRKDDVF